MVDRTSGRLTDPVLQRSSGQNMPKHLTEKHLTEWRF